MSKKTVEEIQAQEAADEEMFNGGDEEGSSLEDLDFNVNDEFKAEPLIPNGTYHGVATSIKFEASKFCITWDFCLHDNGGVMTDGETPVDGSHVYFRNWLPKPGDETEMSKSGKTTKRQSKINMLMDFQSNLSVDMSTPARIMTALEEQQWIGTEADLEIGSSEWNGRFRNDVSKINKSKLF